MKGRTIGIIVARTGSTRVPGKALLDISGQPLISHMIRIARQVKGLDAVWLATSILEQDDVLVQLAHDQGISVSRGDAEKVLDRLYVAAQASKADVIVYLGGDCPLLDPYLVSAALADFHVSNCDYLCNYEPPTSPGGQDINIISSAALKVAYERASAQSQRIHPFSYLTFHPADFTVKNFAQEDDLSAYHWSVDYTEDVEFVRLVYRHLYDGQSNIGIKDVLALIEKEAEVSEYHTRLLKPKVSHAFFSSPGIMKDIIADITLLADATIGAIGNSQFDIAETYFREIALIATKLSNLNGARSEEFNGKVTITTLKGSD